MTDRERGEIDRAPILVLGLGNMLLRDDGVGLELLKRLELSCPDDERLEFIDGGTRGLALTRYLAGRRALLILDAVALGAAPGEVHHVADAHKKAPPPGAGAHEGNAGEFLAAAELLGERPEIVTVVGVEPAELRTGVGLSDPVLRALPRAAALAEKTLGAILDSLDAPRQQTPKRRNVETSK